MNRRSFLGSALAAVATASVGRNTVAFEEPSAASPPGGEPSLREKFFGCIADCRIGSTMVTLAAIPFTALAIFEGQELMGRDWVRTLVTYPLEFKAGQARADAVRLTDGQGQEVPCQLSRLTTHADGSIASARISFYARLPKGLVLPYVDPVAKTHVLWWRGSENATLEYCLTNLRHTCDQYGGDPNAVLFTGFSRGAIAAGYLALRNDQIADVWLGFLPHSHIDGGRFAPDGPRERLARARGRPTLITCGSDDDGKNESPKGARILREFGFPVVERELAGLKHTDRFLDNDSLVRREMRAWMAEVLEHRPGTRTVRGRVAQKTGLLLQPRLHGMVLGQSDAEAKPFFAEWEKGGSR